MYSTVEVRWFGKGNVPANVQHWFHDWQREPEEQPPRTDYYLQLAEGNTLGLKLREGRIEAKQRHPHRQRWAVQFASQVSGYVEYWRKWGFALVDGAAGSETLTPWWVGVEKERKLRTYQVIDANSVEERAYGDEFSLGCAWEMARVQVVESAELWWSVGFEAFGQEADREIALLATLKHALSGTNPPILQLADSHSYPDWLQIVGNAR